MIIHELLINLFNTKMKLPFFSITH